MSGTPRDQGGEVLLVAEQVQKVYRTGEFEVEALAGLDLEVRRGELVAVMGPSGSGKTTLLNCLSGLDDIDGGRVLVEGQDLFALSDARRTAHRPNELSGGEQQRVTVARALVARPAIVWADEPTGNLDTAMAAQVVDLLHELNREDGQTIVLVTHDPGIGASAGRLLRMRDGRLVGDQRQSSDGRWAAVGCHETVGVEG